jgi:hypothetical protein
MRGTHIFRRRPQFAAETEDQDTIADLGRTEVGGVHDPPRDIVRGRLAGLPTAMIGPKRLQKALSAAVGRR